MYSVKEAYLTLQGEGAQAGRAAVFLRFAGCNLWNGIEKGRETAICRFCDTNIKGTDGENGDHYKNPTALAYRVDALWGKRPGKKFVVVTGGEPSLQLDTQVIDKLHGYGFEVAIETNGTLLTAKGVDWICVSPKAGTKIVQTSGDELKLVYPQEENKPEDYQDMNFKHFFLSPKDGGFDETSSKENLKATIQYCLDHPQWRLSLQTHKITGIK